VVNRSVSQLEDQIELTRQALDRTLRALQLQLSPRYQLRRAWNATKEASVHTLHQSGLWARSHPLPVLVIAATLLGMVYLGVRRRRSD
jgi:Protein of unknown function (DUF3618)